jgi:hypothetical protein
MHMNRVFRAKRLIAVTASALLLAGCSSSMEGTKSQVSRSAGSASRKIPGVSLAEVQPVAERIFRQHFRIDQAASGAGLLVAQPQEVTREGQPERVRDILGGSHARHRYLAELRLNQQGPDVLVRCVVQTQRLETSERAAFRNERGQDVPNDTPIQRIGPTSADNREEWVGVKRDRELEQVILMSIAETVQPASAPAK